MTRFALAAALLLLAGCGGRQTLRPPEGASLPVKPLLAQVQPTADQLLAIPTDLQPGRSDELLTKSEQRPEDRFDIPPP